MTEVKLVDILSRQLGELRDEVVDLKERSRIAKSYIYCIGGPLNDNKLGYSRAQMLTFVWIANALDGAYSNNDSSRKIDTTTK